MGSMLVQMGTNSIQMGKSGFKWVQMGPNEIQMGSIWVQIDTNSI